MNATFTDPPQSQSKKKATVESQITLISTSLYSLLSNARKNLLENCADQSPNINANQ
jgi:hypothetical protein